jgi:hypothetical protein
MSSETSLDAKRRNGNLRRRIATLLIKAHEIEGYGVDIAIILKRKNQYTTYGRKLPLLMSKMVVSLFHFIVDFTADSRQEQVAPLPKHLLPTDLEKMTAKRKPRRRNGQQKVPLAPK